jgi:hypothetical protein
MGGVCCCYDGSGGGCAFGFLSQFSGFAFLRTANGASGHWFVLRK